MAATHSAGMIVRSDDKASRSDDRWVELLPDDAEHLLRQHSLVDPTTNNVCAPRDRKQRARDDRAAVGDSPTIARRRGLDRMQGTAAKTIRLNVEARRPGLQAMGMI
jgi:hypothetical protein